MQYRETSAVVVPKSVYRETHHPRTDEVSSPRFNPAGVTHMNAFP